MTQNVVTGSRLLGTVYHNTGTHPIFVTVSDLNTATTNLYAETDSSSSPSTVVTEVNVFLNSRNMVSFWVLPGNYYEVIDTMSGTSTLSYWVEWDVTEP